MAKIIVVGGGAAGMLAAGRAASRGHEVHLYEKNNRLGKKILITGKGRCNITNTNFNEREFAEQFGKNNRFVLNSLYNFSPQKTCEFFNEIGIETIIERGGRVFPKDGNAKTVRDALLKLILQDKNITLLTSTEVESIHFCEKNIEEVITNKGNFKAKNYLITTGGLSYPQTGSTGDGHKFLQKMNLKMVSTSPALTPLITQEEWTKDLKNFNLKNVEVSLFIDNKKHASNFGEAFFTHNGIGGPIVLDLSKDAILALNQNKKVEIIINSKPKVDKKEFEERIISLIAELKKAPIIDLLRKIMPKDMAILFIKIFLNNNAKLKCSELSKVQRKKLLTFMTELKLTITSSEGYKKAIITAGGLDVKEIDSKTMRVRKFENLFVAGEVIDIDAPTGGFNIQVAWSTGFVAGNSI